MFSPPILNPQIFRQSRKNKTSVRTVNTITIKIGPYITKNKLKKSNILLPLDASFMEHFVLSHLSTYRYVRRN